MRNPARRLAAFTVPALLSLAVSAVFAQVDNQPFNPAGGGVVSPTPGASTTQPADAPNDAGAAPAAAADQNGAQPAAQGAQPDQAAPADQAAPMDQTVLPAQPIGPGAPANPSVPTPPVRSVPTAQLGVPTTQLTITPSAASTQAARNTTTSPQTIKANKSVSFNFRDATVESILKYMSESLGFTITVDTGVRLDSRIPMFLSDTPIDADRAVTELNNVLKPLGYGTLRSDKSLRVATIATVRGGNVPVFVGADPAKIPNTEDVRTQVIPLQSVDAVKLRADLAPMLNSDATMTANTGSNSIIVTDSSSNIRRMVEIIAALDAQRVAVSDIRTYPLKYATASSAATLINTIFATPTTGQNGQGGNGFGGGRFGGGGGGGGRFGGGGFGPGGQQAQQADNGGSEIAGKVTASSDDRTNTLVVVGPKAILATIDKIVTELDANPAQDQVFFIYNLKNGQAIDIEPVLNTLFGNQTSGSSTTARQSFSGSSFSSSSGSSAFGSSSSSRGGGGTTGRGGGGGGGGGGFGGGFGGGTTGGAATGNRGGATGGAGGGRVSSSTAAAAGALAGQVFVVSNPDTNALLVTTKAALEKQVRDLIDQLDRPVPQVLIRILIAEVTHSDSDDIGVEFSAVNTRINGKGITAGTDFGIASQSGGLVIGMMEGDVTATLRALAGSNKLDVLSRPYILASDNQLASMIVGQEVPIVTNTQITDTGNTINSVSYQNVGIILDVTPHINPEGLVILDVTPQVSQLDTGGGVAISSTATAPIIDIRAAQTRVGIKNGETIVIGGLMQDQKTQIVQKLPLLGDIPWLGMLFKRTQNSKTKTELLIFLTPHVAQVPGYLKGMAKDDIQGTKLVPDAVTPGTFQDHMRGLERGSTSQPTDDKVTPLTPGKP